MRKSSSNKSKTAETCWCDFIQNQCSNPLLAMRLQTSQPESKMWMADPAHTHPGHLHCQSLEYTKPEMRWGQHLARRVLNGLMSCWRSSSYSLFVTHPTNRDKRHQDGGGGRWGLRTVASVPLNSLWTSLAAFDVTWRHLAFFKHPSPFLG